MTTYSDDIINDSKDTFESNDVIFVKGYPCCSEHGAMNKVNRSGMWRCIMCHLGYDENTKEVFLSPKDTPMYSKYFRKR